MEQFTSGAMFELTLRGDEKVFWANGYSHNPSNPTQKNLTQGDKRREAITNICSIQK